MTDTEINRALAELLEPLASFPPYPNGRDLWATSPKGLWELDCDYREWLPRPYDGAAEAAVALAQAMTGWMIQVTFDGEGDVNALLVDHPGRVQPRDEVAFSLTRTSFPLAVRDCVALALALGVTKDGYSA